jgi:hypothetical protein
MAPALRSIVCSRGLSLGAEENDMLKHLAIVLTTVTLAVSQGHAQTVEDFYRGSGSRSRSAMAQVAAMISLRVSGAPFR